MLGLIGKIIYDYPERGFYEQLFSEGVFREMPLELDNDDFRIGRALLCTYCESPLDLGSLESDYTQLFILGKPATSLWQSAFVSPEHMLFQPSTLKSREWYKKYDLQLKRLYTEPDDHVGLMLIFAGFLADKAVKTEDPDVLNDFENFCSEQILSWAPQWCDQVVLAARTDFYKGLALLAKGVLKSLWGIHPLPKGQACPSH